MVVLGKRAEKVRVPLAMKMKGLLHKTLGGL